MAGHTAGSFSKAHRRVKVRRADQGYQACSLGAPDELWINQVGRSALLQQAIVGNAWPR